MDWEAAGRQKNRTVRSKTANLLEALIASTARATRRIPQLYGWQGILSRAGRMHPQRGPPRLTKMPAAVHHLPQGLIVAHVFCQTPGHVKQTLSAPSGLILTPAESRAAGLRRKMPDMVTPKVEMDVTVAGLFADG